MPETKAFAITNGSDIIRIVMNKDLAEYINAKHQNRYQIKEISVNIGRELASGEESSTSVYALVDRRKGLLRVLVSKDTAQLFMKYKIRRRYLAEANIKFCCEES